MWGSRTIARARRHLGDLAGQRGDRSRAAMPPPTDPAAVGTIELVLSRTDKDAFAVALADRLGGALPRVDSPGRVEAALAGAIERAGGRGRPRVVRSPAGLYTPEYWHVRIDSADAVTREALDRLIDGRRID